MFQLQEGNRIILALDCETNGKDFDLGSRPFLVTMCNDKMEQTFWEWQVDPLTRDVIIPPEDVEEIQAKVEEADELVFQNSKFDLTALFFIGITEWPWDKINDTLISGHLLASNKPHNLTDMATQYLGVNIYPYEEKVHAAVAKARTLARGRLKTWRIAKAGLEEMPSAKDNAKAGDYWLPRAVARELNYAEDHPWHTVTSEYANADSAITVKLWQVHKEKLKQRGLWNHYLNQRQLLQVVWEMERTGVTVNCGNLHDLRKEYSEESERSGRVMVNLARNYSTGINGTAQPYELELPKGGVNGSLRDFCFGKTWVECPNCHWVPKSKKEKAEVCEDTPCPKCLKKKVTQGTGLVKGTFQGLNLVPIHNPKAKTNNPTLDAKTAIPFYLETLPRHSKPLTFMQRLVDKRAYDIALSYMEAYEKYWTIEEGLPDGYARLHPSVNITGTDTLRFSCENPNTQQVGKKKKVNLRKCFGPALGREWWCLDAQNIELRLPAYLCGEQELIDLFERADEPPYYGSEHLLNFSTVYSDIWERELREVGLEKVGPHCKEKYKDTWYQYGKNGGFAVGYGAIERPNGTADRAFHKDGAHRLLQKRFAKKEKLNQECIAFANRHGYIETIPDRTVDPKHGYPLLCTRAVDGRVLPTVPLNYKIQGAACWVLRRGMILVADYLKQLNQEGKDQYHLIMNVHDEIVLDFPYKPNKGNLPKIRKVRRLLESVGDDLIPAIPLPFGVEYHSSSWAEGEVIAC